MKRLTLKTLSDAYGYDGLLKRVLKQAGISLSDNDAYTLVSNVLSWFILEDVAAFIADRDN